MKGYCIRKKDVPSKSVRVYPFHTEKDGSETMFIIEYDNGSSGVQRSYFSDRYYILKTIKGVKSE